MDPCATHIRTSCNKSPRRTVLCSRVPLRGAAPQVQTTSSARAEEADIRRTAEVPARVQGGRRSCRRRLSTNRHHQQATSGICRAMSKRAKMSEPDARTTILSSCVFQFRVDYERIKELPIGKYVHSDVVSAGGHLWRIEFYPRGYENADKGEYISIYFIHMSKSRSVRAIFEAFVMGRDSKIPILEIQRKCETFEIRGDKENGDSWGWSTFMQVTDVEKFLIERHITFICTIMVVDDSPIQVLPSDIGTHLGRLLDHTEGTDVSFIIDDEKFPAHRTVLAARSPVFRAELFGSMAEATMSSITLHDITPATFKVMLQFIYTDELPAEDELEDSSTEMFQNLLAASDRYALDRLKFICAQKLWDKVSIDTVAAILACAKTYNCQELKNKCMDFFVMDENFKEAIFTDGYVPLVLKFPSIAAELRKKVRA